MGNHIFKNKLCKMTIRLEQDYLASKLVCDTGKLTK